MHPADRWLGAWKLSTQLFIPPPQPDGSTPAPSGPAYVIFTKGTALNTYNAFSSATPVLVSNAPLFGVFTVLNNTLTKTITSGPDAGSTVFTFNPDSTVTLAMFPPPESTVTYQKITPVSDTAVSSDPLVGTWIYTVASFPQYMIITRDIATGSYTMNMIEPGTKPSDPHPTINDQVWSGMIFVNNSSTHNLLGVGGVTLEQVVFTFTKGCLTSARYRGKSASGLPLAILTHV